MGFPEALVVAVIALPVLAAVYAVTRLVRFLQSQQLALQRVVSPDGHVATSRDDQTGPVSHLGESSLHAGVVFAARYEIRRPIGSGGMGAVYEAHDLELDSPIALKVIRPEITADSAKAVEFSQRLKQELQLARRVTHRNVLRIHDIGEVHGLKYITMPYIEGADLAELLKQAPFPIDRALHLGRQILEGLATAHDAFVVHRDLKPQNILVDTNDHVYISDFGLAKCVQRELRDLTRTGEIHCTPRYAAPEQVEGKPADPRSDLYALGLVLFEMFTGAVPFSGESQIEVMLARLTVLPDEPRRINPAIPTRINRLIMRCLQRDPESRYQNARQIFADWDADHVSGV